jgi:hypothetical protein
MQRKTFVIFSISIFVLLAHFGLYAAEEIKLISYYPAPYGAYKSLVIGPNGYNGSLFVTNVNTSGQGDSAIKVIVDGSIQADAGYNAVDIRVLDHDSFVTSWPPKVTAPAPSGGGEIGYGIGPGPEGPTALRVYSATGGGVSIDTETGATALRIYSGEHAIWANSSKDTTIEANLNLDIDPTGTDKNCAIYATVDDQHVNDSSALNESYGVRVKSQVTGNHCKGYGVYSEVFSQGVGSSTPTEPVYGIYSKVSNSDNHDLTNSLYGVYADVEGGGNNAIYGVYSKVANFDSDGTSCAGYFEAWHNKGIPLKVVKSSTSDEPVAVFEKAAGSGDGAVEIKCRAKLSIPNIPVFANVTERQNAIPYPKVGDICYMNDTTKALYIYVDGTWRKEF